MSKSFLSRCKGLFDPNSPYRVVGSARTWKAMLNACRRPRGDDLLNLNSA